ncbi:peptidase family C69 [Marinobacter sp. chi1]|uniref:Peptidase family C69 n=1 Tax=Marinobacter suaedae TaxID=3057675 RepID=A0ABT8W3B8_9GAMM|nr:carcinine hydrolase/isopenicillin-N N-acyltransferase family protein [Marinobacter sp. chi1]MDO3722663.1 peptidase family C69 [Marinobacter sp. chi1]
MCDTLVYRTAHWTMFAKNSDREPGEIQHTSFIPAVSGDTAKTLRTTYLDIPQVPNRNALVLSRPFWMWGAEMGVNDKGLVIGNEAVFSRQVAKSGAALLGMDLLRLALERCDRASDAIQCIGELLAVHGQGGPAGYRDKSFRYDSSFILADPSESWIMETAGKDWVARKLEQAGAISNAYSLHGDYTWVSDTLSGASENELFDFASRFDTRFMRTLGCAATRRAQGLSTLDQLHASSTDEAVSVVMTHLRSHHSPDRGIARGSNRDICMHAASILRPSQTCGSMIVCLEKNRKPQLWLTGTSAPCLSLFQALDFPDSETELAPVFYQEDQAQQSHWLRFEAVHRRALLCDDFQRELLADRDEVQARILQLANEGDIRSGQALAERWHTRWQDKARGNPIRYSRLNPYHRYWKARNQEDGIG